MAVILQVKFEKIALLRYKYKSIRPVLLEKGFKFGEKEGSETSAHTY